MEVYIVHMCWRLLSAIKWEKTRFQDLVNEESITSDFIPRELPTSQFLMIQGKQEEIKRGEEKGENNSC